MEILFHLSGENRFMYNINFSNYMEFEEFSCRKLVYLNNICTKNIYLFTGKGTVICSDRFLKFCYLLFTANLLSFEFVVML